MNPYDARQQLIEGLEQYVAGIETAEGLLRLANSVSAYHEQMPAEAYRLVKGILEAGCIARLVSRNAAVPASRDTRRGMRGISLDRPTGPRLFVGVTFFPECRHC